MGLPRPLPVACQSVQDGKRVLSLRFAVKSLVWTHQDEVPQRSQKHTLPLRISQCGAAKHLGTSKLDSEVRTTCGVAVAQLSCS